MSYQDREKARLANIARERWGLPSHVLPYNLAPEMLHDDIRASTLDYFERHHIIWWTSRWDRRTSGVPARPTGHLNSSQVACVNHLEPARLDHLVADRIVANVDATLRALPTDDGFVDFEWIGLASYLNEPGPRSRGANITSLDAVMCAAHGASPVLLAIEWKYLESYGNGSVARSARGTDRVATYRPLLEHPDCPIAVENVEWLFFEPYYQLMRQTLLAWQMVEHGEFGAVDWLHVHVVPEGNLRLRSSRAAPNLAGSSMAEKWRSVLKRPDRYRVMTPTEVVAGVGDEGRWTPWRQWLHGRYLT